MKKMPIIILSPPMIVSFPVTSEVRTMGYPVDSTPFIFPSLVRTEVWGPHTQPMAGNILHFSPCVPNMNPSKGCLIITSRVRDSSNKRPWRVKPELRRSRPSGSSLTALGALSLCFWPVTALRRLVNFNILFMKKSIISS